MTDVIIDLNAAEAQLHAELQDAREAESQVQAKLGDAILAATTGGGAVPGKLQQALEDARSRRIGIEAALDAASRSRSTTAKARISAARAARAEAIANALDELQAGVAQIEAALKSFTDAATGARAVASLGQVMALTSDMQDRVLSPNGWLIVEELVALRESRAVTLTQLAAQAMAAAMNGKSFDGMSAYVADLRKGIAAGMAVQPANWLEGIEAAVPGGQS